MAPARVDTWCRRSAGPGTAPGHVPVTCGHPVVQRHAGNPVPKGCDRPAGMGRGGSRGVVTPGGFAAERRRLLQPGCPHRGLALLGAGSWALGSPPKCWNPKKTVFRG